MVTLHADVLATLRDWTPALEVHDRLRQEFFALLEARPDACRRTCVPGHITASALVLDRVGERVLLTHHKIVGRWLQFGGHLEGDASLLDAARREAAEESGIADLWFDPNPLGLDIHPITCRNSPPTRHFDVRFLAIAPDDAQPVVSDESHDVRWWPVGALPDTFAEVQQLVHLGVARVLG